MGKKFFNEIIKVYTYADWAIMALMALIALWIAAKAGMIFWGIVCVVLFFAAIGYSGWITTKYTEKKLADYQQELSHEKATVMQSFSDSNPLLLCLSDTEGTVHWKNNLFDAAFTEEDCKSLLDPALIQDFFSRPKSVKEIKFKNKTFRVSGVLVGGESDKLMLFFENVTAKTVIKQLYKDSRTCMAFINIDNFDDLLESVGPEEQAAIKADIDGELQTWAQGLDAALIKVRSARYQMIFEQKYLKKLCDKKFDILNKVHDIETSDDFPVSITIGVGVGSDSLAALQDDALEALDLGQGRGGDQAVVRRKGGGSEFYGGALTTVEKRNKGKSRIIAHALKQLIEGSDRVIVTGHKRPDLDCFGAAVGVSAMARNIGVAADIVLDTDYDAVDIIYETAKQQENLSFISEEEAVDKLTHNTLVILVDTHLSALAEASDLIDKASKIVIIDHHRKSPDAIDSPTLAYMESSASSTCELVTEILQYVGDKVECTRFELEALLAGIMVDTKNFTTNTGMQTFDAASWLKRGGATSNSVKNFFKMDLDLYKKKFNIIANAEILDNGVAVAYTKEKDPGMQLLVAQAADELLEMKGVDAAFASGSSGDATVISARSLGKINVQTIMESLGGGGHMNVAAAQVQESPEEAIAKVVAYMRESGVL